MYKAVRALLFLPLVLMAIHSVRAEQQVPRYGKFEASWTLPNQTGNPFDPAVNDIDVVFHTPKGTSEQVPAFWDGGSWRVRFAPVETGQYSLSVLRNGAPAHPIALSATHFHCIASKSPGFIVVDQHHRQHFEFSNGVGYYPIGMDQAWGGSGVPAYPQLFQIMNQNGLNWSRIWMTFWDGKALDWAQNAADNPKIGWLSMDTARTWDSIMDAADSENVNVQMTLQHHGQYTAVVNPNWSENPFNVANGGFLQQPQDFFTNPEAIRLTKAKYRYIVARWGYSTHLMAFELFNEVQNIQEAHADFGAVVAWHKTMAAYIRSMDVNHHLITTSISAPPDPLSNIGLSYDQIHSYVPDVISYFSSLQVADPSIPIFLGEWGSSSPQQTEGVVHDGLWSGIMDTTAAAPEFWYGDGVYKNNWWPDFKSTASFIAASNMAGEADFEKLSPDVIHSTGHADLSFAPSGDWGNTTSSDVNVDPNGTITGLGGVSSYIQGQGHRDMMPQPIAFHLQCTHPCQFELKIETVSQAGAQPTLSLDGVVATSSTYGSASANHQVHSTLTVLVPAGTHVVSLSNPGPDWFTVNKIVITDYAPALAAVGKANHKEAYFWAYNRDRSGDNPISGEISLTGLAPGRYQVHLWDTQSGRPLGAPYMTHTDGGALMLEVPTFGKDIAGWAIRK